jgi:hypothetical protein
MHTLVFESTCEAQKLFKYVHYTCMDMHMSCIFSNIRFIHSYHRHTHTYKHMRITTKHIKHKHTIMHSAYVQVQQQNNQGKIKKKIKETSLHAACRHDWECVRPLLDTLLKFDQHLEALGEKNVVNKLLLCRLGAEVCVFF